MNGGRAGRRLGMCMLVLAIVAYIAIRTTSKDERPGRPRTDASGPLAGAAIHGLTGALCVDVAARAKNATVFIQSRQVSYLDENDAAESGGTYNFVPLDAAKP